MNLNTFSLFEYVFEPKHMAIIDVWHFENARICKEENISIETFVVFSLRVISFQIIWITIMCSIGEDDFGDEGGAHSMQVEPKVDSADIVSGEICKKCNERNVVVKINLKDAQCGPCFFQYVRHKFRAALGATRVVERGAKVVLVFDGSVECCVMFDMVRYALTQEKFKRLTYTPCALIVDDTCAFEPNVAKRQEYLQESLTQLEHFQFDTFYTSVATKNEPPVRIEDFQNFRIPVANLEKDVKFAETLNSIKSPTSRDDFVLAARANAIRSAAAQLDCNYAFLSAISHQVATTLLVNVALGRGSSVANDISFCDNRPDCQVKLLRPIRNLSSLEVDTYVRLSTDKKWPTVNRNYANNTNANSNASIQNLTTQFVNGLQENFASTVSTVFRTGDKIAAAATTPSNTSDDATQRKSCKFCHSTLDYENSATLFAIEYSRCVSACADRNEVNDVDLMIQRANAAVQGDHHSTTNDNHDEDIKSMWKHLCHGCRNIFRDLESNSNHHNNYVISSIVSWKKCLVYFIWWIKQLRRYF